MTEDVKKVQENEELKAVKEEREAVVQDAELEKEEDFDLRKYITSPEFKALDEEAQMAELMAHTTVLDLDLDSVTKTEEELAQMGKWERALYHTPTPEEEEEDRKKEEARKKAEEEAKEVARKAEEARAQAFASIDYKVASKAIMRDNVSYLANKKDLRISEIEEAIGVSKGYLSRLGKEGSQSPSMDKVIGLAQHLDVSLDTLLYVRLSDMTVTYRKIVAFMDKVRKQVREGKTEWKKIFYGNERWFNGFFHTIGGSYEFGSCEPYLDVNDLLAENYNQFYYAEGEHEEWKANPADLAAYALLDESTAVIFTRYFTDRRAILVGKYTTNEVGAIKGFSVISTVVDTGKLPVDDILRKHLESFDKEVNIEGAKMREPALNIIDSYLNDGN